MASEIYAARMPHQCRGKRQYPQMTDARRGASYLYHQTREPVHAYPCLLCGKYHVGGYDQIEAQQDRKPSSGSRDRPRTQDILNDKDLWVTGDDLEYAVD